uniref:Uncharacterized protein n=2 Tax=Rhizochromulina marina TaxID=1034831 RepID=A0A7S2WT61_9STRA|mmetsp:Transcript_32604/g.94414  ORF Transcript_32604/g.94414 Transcript_32604/m.94414 type:complete len:139 (+) Transcript_32604:22-438(+)
MASGRGKVLWFPSGVSLVNWWKCCIFGAGMVSAAVVTGLTASGYSGKSILEYLLPFWVALLLIPFVVDLIRRWMITRSISAYFMGAGPWVDTTQLEEAQGPATVGSGIASSKEPRVRTRMKKKVSRQQGPLHVHAELL